jgi:hypothetical protein
VRTDYRLRDRMANAEALAKKVTETEAKLRALGWVSGDGSSSKPHVALPPVSPQDGNVELEAKAGLFADEAQKLDGEANRLAKAAEELRNRRLLRRRAGAWERDPFSGLESSKRSLAGTSAGTSAGPRPAPDPKTGTGDSSGSSGSSTTFTVTTSSSEATASAKTSPQASGAFDRQTIDQRLYLDPTTAALRTRARALQSQAQTLLQKSRAP